MEQQRRTDQDKFKHQDQHRVMAAQNQNHPHHPAPPPQKCPRCDSSNTKFCYYNNYSLSQPRYFCKACRRYWTQGGTLRNVPVGGGCRKSKRPKPSIPSLSSAAEIARSQPLPSQNLMNPSLRPLPPMIPSFYNGGSFLSSLAAMQSLSNQGQPPPLNLGGGYEANMAALQSLRPAPPHQFQFPNDQYFLSQQNMRPSFTSWTQSFINRGPATTSTATATATTTSAASPSFWSGAAADGVNSHAGSSFNQNQNWQESNQRFDPSSQ